MIIGSITQNQFFRPLLLINSFPIMIAFMIQKGL